MAILEAKTMGHVLILQVKSDHVDAANSNDFRTVGASLIHDSKSVLLDLEGVNFIDSAGLGALLSLMRKVKEAGGDFRVCCVSRAIQVLFELVRMHKVLEIYTSRTEAMSAMARLKEEPEIEEDEF